MARIDRFEDIQAWQKARELTRRVYAVTARGEFAKDFGLRDQIRRAACSIMSNIAEGFERDGNTEFRQFLSVAKGSAGEVRAQLYVALDAGFISEAEFSELQSLVLETGNLIRGLMSYLRQTSMQGSKFR